MDVSQFLHIPTEGHLGYFQVLATMNKAAVYICVQIFEWTCFQLLWVTTKEHDCWIMW